MYDTDRIEQSFAASATQKVVWRIGGLLALASLLQGLDRLNISYAGIALRHDLGFSASQFGTGAGVFFLSYVAFGLPSNLMLVWVGARRWLTIMMVAWGLASAGMAFAVGPTSFYLLRLVLGAAEAGFAPAMLYLVSVWMPPAVRGRVLAMLLAMSPVAAVIGGPLSAALLAAHGAHGLAGWQRLFVAEGVPTVLLAGVMWRLMSDGPSEARWLGNEERTYIQSAGTPPTLSLACTNGKQHWSRAVLHPATLGFGFVIFSLAMLGFSLMFFLPQIIHLLGFSETVSVSLAAVPPLAGILFMFVWSRSSDRTGERRWHFATATFCAITGAVVAAWASNVAVGLTALAVSVGGAYAAQPLAWAIAQQRLRGETAAVTLALIHSIANVSGFLGPTLMGVSRDMTGSFALGLSAAAAIGLTGLLTLLVMTRVPAL